ncbi:hypothetical protein KGQ74_00690 [Patescibacteria group bacterium]|nr:hypothetical protein [Patescibacteria group bacterium]
MALDFQEKRKVRKVIYSRLTLFVLLVAVILLARATYRIYATEEVSATDYASVLAEYDGLKQRQAVLGSEVSRLGTPVGQDEEIRDKFSVAKPGEAVVVVVGATASAASLAPTSTSLWQKFLHLFK